MDSLIVKLFENSVLGALLFAGLWVVCRILVPLAHKSIETTQRAIDLMEEATTVMRQNTESNQRVVKALEAWARLVGVELRARQRTIGKAGPPDAY